MGENAGGKDPRVWEKLRVLVLSPCEDQTFIFDSVRGSQSVVSGPAASASWENLLETADSKPPAQTYRIRNSGWPSSP